MSEPTLLDWSISIAAIPSQGLKAARAATVEERQALAQALELVDCDRLELRYHVKATSNGGFRLEGTLQADITQACVVTLELVPARLTVPLTIVFSPAAPVANASGPDIADPFASEEVETIQNGYLLLGQIVFEELLTALDPYPRASGAEFDWKDPADSAATPSAFSKLAALKEKLGKG